MTSNFRASLPSSSSILPSSLFFAANAKALCHPRPLRRRFHESFVSCSRHESSNRPSFPEGSHAGSSCIWRSSRPSSAICESNGRDDAETSSFRYCPNNEDAAPARMYDNAEFSRRGIARTGRGHGSSESFERNSASPYKTFGGEPPPSRYFQGLERFRRDFPDSGNYRDPASFDRESPATGTYRPRNFVRDYPARIDRLQEVVSRNHGSVQNYNKLSFLGDASRVRVPADSPFKNSMVSVFWDLDNKPPTSSPYESALFLRDAASQFGSVVDMVAYANYHAFTYVPEWVREQRRDKKELDFLERKGIVQPDKPYVCELCGRRCKTNLLLKKHFKDLHEREHNKRMNRLNSLKGKKREKYRAAVMPKTQRYKQAASPILVPRVGYGLESDLRRAGVSVKTVQFKPQAADLELKRQVANSIQKGVKCICLVSDDTGFSTMLADARALNLRTIVFGDSKSLKRYADFWFPWEAVVQGIPAEHFQEAIHRWSIHHEEARQRDLKILAGLPKDDSEVEHKIFRGSTPVLKPGFSAFSEEEPMLEEVGYVSAYPTSSEEEPMLEEVGYVSASDDEGDWSFEDDDTELHDGWEANVEDRELG